jgi:hypothetical protein
LSALSDVSFSAFAGASDLSASLSFANKACSAAWELYNLFATTATKVIIRTSIIASPIFASLFIFILRAEIASDQLFPFSSMFSWHKCQG